MKKYRIIDLWNVVYGNKEEVYDYAGRLMKKSACGNPNSKYHPTIDHIWPLTNGGFDDPSNMIICHRTTNLEKSNHFPHWKTNGRRFKAIRERGNRKAYNIIEI